jgi:tetratricopeptide (TPR) repeat protein
LDAAEEYFAESLVIKREVGDRHGQAKSLNNLGGVAGQRGELDAALGYFEDAFDIDLEVGALSTPLTTVENLVDACEQAGRVEDAVNWCERGVEVAGRAGDDEAAEQFRTRRASLRSE